MVDSDPNSDDSSFQRNYFYTHSISYLIFFLIISLFSIKVSAQQQLDSAKAKTFYRQVIRQTECGGIGNGLSESEFYLLLALYIKQDEKRNYYPQGYNPENRQISQNAPSNNSSEKQTSPSDSFVRVIYIHDTIMQPSSQDTVFLGSATPTSDDIAFSQEVLKKIIQDRDLSELIRETVNEMSADELNDFKKDLNKEFLEIKNELTLEKARRKIAELEAKKEEQLARRERHKEQKENWKVLSKEERKELIKAKATVLAYGAAAAAGTAGLAVVGVGAILGAGVLAIGKGIIRAPIEIWNWLDDHFYVKIDLSCATQRQIRAYRMTHNYKPRPIKKYSGHCPGW